MLAEALKTGLLKRHTRDALWVACGAALTASGTLAGVRLLTQFLPPAVYGVVALALGASTLALGLISTPLTQAAMHFHPGMQTQGKGRELEKSLLRILARLAPWVLLLVGGAVIVCARRQLGAPVAIAAAGVLFCIDSLRSASLSLLNSARRHRRYALWTAIDAWSRPLVATGAVLLLSGSPEVVLFAYVGVAAVLLAMFSGGQWTQSPPVSEHYSPSQRRALDGRMWSYALPLVPLGIINWASNLGDRYIIGGTLGLAAAGLYAAVYGLSSYPFMLVGGTVETVLRPVHQAAVTSGDHARARSVLILWLALVGGICSLGVVALALGHYIVARLFLGPSYRSWSILMPWIGLGYAIRSTSYVFERVCYAYGRPRRVLAIQLFAAVATVIATPIGVLVWGLMGAAVAVGVYFTVQLTAAIVFARRTLREAAQVRCDPAAAVGQIA